MRTPVGTNLAMTWIMDKRRSCANCGSMDHHVSACSAYKQNMKSIGYFLEDVDATDEDHEEYVRGLIMKYGPRCFFCNLEGHFKSDCTQFWDAVADAKHPRHEEALSGVKASRARLMNEAESRRKETIPSTFTTKKVKTLPDEVVASNLEAESSSPLKVDNGLAARTALQNVKQDLATKEVEQWVRSELESTDLRESFNILGKTTKVEDKEEPRKQGLKLNVLSGRIFGMTKEGTKIMSIISVAGHQVVKNLSEPSEITLVHLDIYADYLKEKDPKLDSRAVRALLTAGGPRLMKVDGHYIDVHGPYPVLMNVDGINIYTKAHITDANDQIGRIYIGQEELKVRRIGHNAMLEQDAVHIGCEADLAAHVLDVQGRQLSGKGLLDTGAVVSVMPVKTWIDMGFERSDLIPTNIRLAAANPGAIYVIGRTPIISLQLGGRHLWMSFLVVENLDESDQFILGRDFVRNFDVTIDLNDGLIRIKDPERKYEKRPLNNILINQAKVPIFLVRKVRLKPNQAVVATFRMRNLNELSNDRQVCLVPSPNSKSSAILGRSFSLTQSGLCVSVLLNTEATTVTIQRGKKLGYALPLNTDFQSVENLKKFDVTKCPLHANQECIIRRVNELKSSRKLFSMKSETDDGLSSCSNFPERPTEAELAANKPVLPEIEHLKGKISDKELDSLRAVLNRNADVFSEHKADIGCCNFVEHEIEIEEGSVPHREGARRMTPNKSEACRKEIEMLMEYDMIEPSKSPWACGVVMAKKKGGQLRFCCDFRYLNAVTIKDAYPIPRIDESLSKLGDAKFFTTLDLGSAFWQVPLRKQDREETGFACELGLFQWKMMPFGLCPRNDMSRKSSSASPTRPMSDGITMGASSTFDRLMTSKSKQKGGASSSTRLQPQLTSSSLGLTPSFGATGDISDKFAGVMNGLDELRRDMTKRIDQVDERAHQGRENLRDELTHAKSQAKVDQAQLIRNTDQCLAESLAQANKESQEREARMTKEIERLLNEHDSTYAHTMTSLEKRLDAKSDLMMRKLDAILNGSNWQERSNQRERSRHANDGDGTGSNARAQQSSRTNYEPRDKERPRAAPSRPGWTNPVPPEADATPEIRLPTVPQVSSVPDLTTVSQDTTMYASMFEPLNRSLETFITKLSKSTERGERSRRTLKKPKSYKDESDGWIDTWIEVMKLHFEEESLSKKQECSALTSNLEGTALSCLMAKRANERDSARKIFDILLNRFGSGVQGHQAMVKFEKRRQREVESINKFLDDLELLRRRSNPDERISERNLAIASKFMDGVRSEELKTMLATHFTLSLDQVPTPDDLRMKSREYLLIKPRAQNRYSNYGNYSGTNTGANSSWYKPRDDMDHG